MTADAEDVRRLREFTGEGLQRCKRAFEMASDPAQPFEGDVLWAICTLMAEAYAVNIQPPEARAKWNLEKGAGEAARLRADPAVAEAFPPKGDAPTP